MSRPECCQAANVSLLPWKVDLTYPQETEPEPDPSARRRRLTFPGCDITLYQIERERIALTLYPKGFELTNLLFTGILLLNYLPGIPKKKKKKEPTTGQKSF